MRYPDQLAAKQRRVEAALAPWMAQDALRPILPATAEFGYRNRAQFKTDGRQLGYVAGGSRAIAPIEDCAVLSPHNRASLRTLVESLPHPPWKPAQRQAWTTLDIDESVTGHTVSVNARLPFRQPNDAQNAVMRQWLAVQLQALSPGPGQVLELFAGSGNFTEVIAAAGAVRVLAVEAVREATAVLEGRGLPGVEVLTCDLFAQGSVAKLTRCGTAFDTLVLDPPREGFAGLGELLAAFRSLRRVYYLSCDLPTFGRDLQVIAGAGFRADEIQPLDALPQTAHVELLAAFSR